MLLNHRGSSAFTPRGGGHVKVLLPIGFLASQNAQEVNASPTNMIGRPHCAMQCQCRVIYTLFSFHYTSVQWDHYKILRSRPQVPDCYNNIPKTNPNLAPNSGPFWALWSVSGGPSPEFQTFLVPLNREKGDHQQRRGLKGDPERSVKKDHQSINISLLFENKY